jgi:general secretion pathway protein G
VDAIVSAKVKAVVVGTILLAAVGALVSYRSVIVVPSGRIRDSETIFRIERLYTALDFYYLDCGAYPSTNAGLTALLTNDGQLGWRGPYFKVDGTNWTDILSDDWGTPFKYVLDRGEPIIVSAGRDKRFGTDDDQDIKIRHK